MAPITSRELDFTGSTAAEPAIPLSSPPIRRAATTTININQGNLQSRTTTSSTRTTTGTLTVQSRRRSPSPPPTRPGPTARRIPAVQRHLQRLRQWRRWLPGRAQHGTPDRADHRHSGTGIGAANITAHPRARWRTPTISISYGTGTLTITPAMLTAQASNQNAAPATSPPTSSSILGTTYTVSGFANGDTTAILSGFPTLACSETISSPPGTLPDHHNCIGSLASTNSNYTITLASGVLHRRPSVVRHGPERQQGLRPG